MAKEKSKDAQTHTEKAKANPWVYTIIFIIAALLTALIAVLVALFAVYLHRKKHSVEELSWPDVLEVLLITAALAVPVYVLGWYVDLLYLPAAFILYYWQKSKVKQSSTKRAANLAASEKNATTFSTGYFMGGVGTGIVLWGVIGTIPKAFNPNYPVNALAAYLVAFSAAMLLCVFLLADALKGKKVNSKSFMIGVLGLLIGLIAERFINVIRGSDDQHYPLAVFSTWLVLTAASILVIFAVALAS